MQEGKVYIFDTTKAQLAEHLNHIEESGDLVLSVHHTGGRDWTLVCRAARVTRQPKEGRVAHEVRRGARDGQRA